MARSGAGLTDDQVVLEPEAIKELVKSYSTESGVKDLQKHIEKVSTISCCIQFDLFAI